MARNFRFRRREDKRRRRLIGIQLKHTKLNLLDLRDEIRKIRECAGCRELRLPDEILQDKNLS